MARPSAILTGALLALAVPAHGLQRQRTEVDRGVERGSPDEIELLVVDCDGKPLPDAELRFAVEDERPGMVRDESAPGGRREALYLQAPPDASSVDRMLQYASAVRPDATGNVRIAWPRGRGLLVSGRSSDLWGFRWFPRDWRETAGRALPEGEPSRVELFPDWSLTVMVTDEQGRPLENAVIFLRRDGWRHYGAGERFEHLGYDLRNQIEPFVVGIEGLLSPPVQESLDPRRAPAGPIILRMPPTGSVHVQVLEPDGKPSQRRTTVRLRFASDPAPGSLRFDGSELGVTGMAREGSVTFDRVSLGRELEASVEGGTMPLAKTRFRGPSGAGEMVDVSVSIGAGVPHADGEEPLDLGDRLVSGPELSPGGSLRGFVLLDPGIPTDGISIVVSSTDRSSVPGGVAHAGIDGDGKFSIPDVPAGPAKLEIVPRSTAMFRPEEKPVLFRADLRIAPGENVDPRLACIDLCGKVFAHHILLQGMDPGRAFHARVYFGPARRWMPPRCYERIFELPLVLVSPWPSIDVDLFAPGYRSVSLHDLGQRAELELEPGIPVKLRLATVGVLPEPPRYLKAVLVPADEPLIGIDWEGPAFDATREVSTFAWKPGRMKVLWIAAAYDEDGRRGGGVAPEVSPPQYVDVQDSDREQVFEVQLSAEQLARILRELD